MNQNVILDPRAIRSFSLRLFQGLNSSIYLIQNDRNFEVADMVSRMSRYSTHILKAVRKGKLESIPHNLCMGFSWSMALANRFHIDSDDETWKRFPGVCPYCASAPCLGVECKQKTFERKSVQPGDFVRPASLDQLQIMFARIYPHNTIQDASAHLAEESAELSEAIEEYMGTHNPKLFDKIVEELVDVHTNQLAVANCLRQNLAFEMEGIFSKGCPECQTGQGNPCRCGFTTHDGSAKSVVVSTPS